MEPEKSTSYHEIFRPVTEALQMSWQTLGKFVAKLHYHRDPLPPPDPERPIDRYY